MLYFWLIISIIPILTYIFPNYYISELIISFLPYIIAIILPIMIISFFKFRKIIKTWTLSKWITEKLRWILIILSTTIFLLLSKDFNNFYNLQTIPNTTNTSWEIKILYANIHKDNTNYTGIENTIKENNPDIIMFVEFADHHYTHLKDFLQENYPYINSTTRSKKFIGSMVFSKYKVNNRADNFEQWSRRYAYFSIQNWDHKNYFYLVHSSSPDTYNHFTMRNRQLDTFINDVQTHQQWYRDPKDQVMIIWDFNVSPRSYYYKNFEKWLETWFINISRQFPFLFTWKLKQLPIFYSHIDHIRSDNPETISNLHTINIPWSDHKGYTIYLQNF